MSDPIFDLGGSPGAVPPPTAEQQAQLRASMGLGFSEATSATDIEVGPPSGEYPPSAMFRVFVRSTGGGNLTLASGIGLPSDSGFSEPFSKILDADKIYVIQLIRVGSGWGLLSVVGGY